MPMTVLSPELQAIEIIAPRKFHRIFTVPDTDTRGPLKVTYGIAGVEDGEDVPTILFCGGMFGVRWQAVFLNWLAEKEGVRILFIDRPGFGGSTRVPLPDRLSTFLEVAPLLLAHLNIKHITLASHSAGTIYALNLLTHHPELLHPQHPSIALFSPWVHQSLSSVSMLVLACLLPNVLLNYWNKITSFMLNTAQPAFSISGGSITFVTSAFKSRVGTAKTKREEEEKCLRGFGVGTDVKKEVDKAIFKYVFEEDTYGANDEARLCLKSTRGTEWDACEDFVECVANLKRVWERRVEEGGKKLAVRIVLPEEDMMIEEKGKRYFRQCWESGKCGEGIKVEIEEMKEMDHESVVDPSNGAIGKLCDLAKVSRS